MVTHLHMGWRDVCFANWPVDPEVVAPHLPDGVSVDTYDDRAWLSVTPFTNVDVRPAFVPRGWGIPLPEINLRTYVRRDGDGADDAPAGESPATRRAPDVERRERADVSSIYFFSLDAAGIAAVLGARLTHRLPYYYARIEMAPEGEGFRFASRRRHPGSPPASFRGYYEPTGDRFLADAGSLAEFLTDRDRYYTVGRRGELRYADVRHEPWPLYEARAAVEENTLFQASGLDHPESDPVFLYSPGVTTLATPSRRP